MSSELRNLFGAIGVGTVLAGAAYLIGTALRDHPPKDERHEILVACSQAGGTLMSYTVNTREHVVCIPGKGE